MSNIKVIKYFGDSCAPCKVMAPFFERVKDSLSDQGITFESRNIGEEDYADEARSFGARGIPTFIVFENARPLAMKTGIMAEESLKKFILDAIKGD